MDFHVFAQWAINLFRILRNFECSRKIKDLNNV